MVEITYRRRYLTMAHLIEIDPKMEFSCSPSTQATNFNPLMVYIILGDEERVKFITWKALEESQISIPTGCPYLNQIFHKNSSSWSPLDIAARNGKPGMVEMILEVMEKSKIGNSSAFLSPALQLSCEYSAENGNLESAEQIIRFIKEKTKFSIMDFIIKNSNTPVFVTLLNNRSSQQLNPEIFYLIYKYFGDLKDILSSEKHIIFMGLVKRQELEKQIDRGKEQEKTESQLKELIEKYAVLDKHYDALTVEYNDLNAKYKKSVGECDELIENYKQLSDDCIKYSAENRKLMEENRLLSEKEKELERDNEDLETQVKNLTMQVNNTEYLKKQIYLLTQEKEDLLEKNNNLFTDSNNTHHEKGNLKFEKEKLLEEKLELLRKNETLSKENKKLSDENKDLKVYQLVNTHVVNETRSNGKKEPYESKIEELEEQNQKLKDDLLSQSQVMANLQEANNSQFQTIANLINNRYSGDKESYTVKIAELEEKVQKLSRESAAADKAFAKLHSEKEQQCIAYTIWLKQKEEKEKCDSKRIKELEENNQKLKDKMEEECRKSTYFYDLLYKERKENKELKSYEQDFALKQIIAGINEAIHERNKK